MTSDVDETTRSHDYRLSCSDCAFETTVEGSSFDALTVATEHQEANGDSPTDHFVNFDRR